MNLFNVPVSSQEELFDTLFKSQNTHIERIVSYGQVSPDGFWYDQDEDEWVAVIDGEAQVLFEGEHIPRRLGRGDTLFIPARTRHCVTKTANPLFGLRSFRRFDDAIFDYFNSLVPLRFRLLGI
jgi:cupin 2 domain-containing protein